MEIRFDVGEPGTVALRDIGNSVFEYDGYLYVTFRGTSAHCRVTCDNRGAPCLNLVSHTIRELSGGQRVRPVPATLVVNTARTRRYGQDIVGSAEAADAVDDT